MATIDQLAAEVLRLTPYEARVVGEKDPRRFLLGIAKAPLVKLLLEVINGFAEVGYEEIVAGAPPAASFDSLSDLFAKLSETIEKEPSLDYRLVAAMACICCRFFWAELMFSSHQGKHRALESFKELYWLAFLRFLINLAKLAWRGAPFPFPCSALLMESLSFKRSKPEFVGEVLEAFCFFCEEILVARCGFDPAVAAPCPELNFVRGPLSHAAENNEVELMRYLHSKGAEVKGDVLLCCPACMSVIEGRLEAFTTLVELGFDPSRRYPFQQELEGDFSPVLEKHRANLFHFMLAQPKPLDTLDEATKRGRLEIIRLCLQADPSLATVPHLVKSSNKSFPGYDDLRYPLELSFMSRSTEPVRMILDAGGEIWRDDTGDDVPSGSVIRRSTARIALANASPEVLEMMIEERGLLKDWETAYTESAKRWLAMALCVLAADAVFSEGEAAKEARQKVHLLFEAGFSRADDDKGGSSIIPAFVKEGLRTRLLQEREPAVVEMLKLFHSHGCKDLGRPVFNNKGEPLDDLANVAARYNLPKVLCFAVETVGIDVNAYFSKLQPALAGAFCSKHWDLALLLREKYGAKLVFRQGLPWMQQPLPHLFTSSLTDDQALSILRRLLANLSDEQTEALLDPAVYLTSSPQERELPDSKMTPVFAAAATQKPDCLQLLLTWPGLKHKEKALRAPCWFEGGAGIRRVATPIQCAADLGLWRLVEVMLKHGSPSVLDKPDPSVLPAHLASSTLSLPSVMQSLQAKGCPDRGVRALIETAAKKEQKEKGDNARALAAREATLAVGAASNTFEDRALAGEVAARAAAREEKKNAKRRAAKKKAKAKKKKGAANAEAGKAEAEEHNESSDDDDDDEDEEEEPPCLPGEDNLVDTTDVPDLTAMLEEARLERERNNKGKEAAEGGAASDGKIKE